MSARTVANDLTSERDTGKKGNLDAIKSLYFTTQQYYDKGLQLCFYTWWVKWSMNWHVICSVVSTCMEIQL